MIVTKEDSMKMRKDNEVARKLSWKRGRPTEKKRAPSKTRQKDIRWKGVKREAAEAARAEVAKEKAEREEAKEISNQEGTI